MKKMTTLFEKTEDQRQCIDKIRPENEWVLTNSKAYRKWDGTACAVIDGVLYRRYDAKLKKDGTRKIPPPNSIACQEPDKITGHQPYWTPVLLENGGQRMLDTFEILQQTNLEDGQEDLKGTFEFCGPKINGNPENLDKHYLIPHTQTEFNITDYSFESLKKGTLQRDLEGIVFWEIDGNRKCKIRKTDFGLVR